MMTKNEIVRLLETNDKAIAHALVVLYKNQTLNEQRSETTINRNGEGFRPCHARMGTSMAEFYQKRGFLSSKQVAYWRVKDKNGDMRLSIYWRQLAEAAEVKAAKKGVAQILATTVTQPQPTVNVHPDELAMQQMEAQADQEQSRKEEWLKAVRKGYLER
jgi:hypothetical protein